MPIELCRSPLALAASNETADLNHQLVLLALAAFSTVWVTVLGAAIGSFLNVVIYRLPRGMSLLRPKSQCPVCGTPIRPGDNLPVLGWLRLRGRCRSCGNPISSRYPLVEAATALLFLGLAHFELFSGGANLPGGPEGGSRLGFILWNIQPALIALAAYHALLLAILLCLSLIAWDGFPPPRRLLFVAVTVGILSPALLPSLHPVDARLPIEQLPALTIALGKHSLTIHSAALVEACTGLVAGAVFGLLLAMAVPPSPRAAADRRGTIASAALLGTFLGAIAAITCGLLAACLLLGNAVASRLLPRPLPTTAAISVTVLVQIPLWRMLATETGQPGPASMAVLHSLGLPVPDSVAVGFLAAIVVTLLAALLARWITRGG